MAQKSFLAKHKFQVLGFVLLLAIGAWMGIGRFASPAEINLVSMGQDSQFGRKEVCTQIAGTCMNSANQCVTFTDGCQQAKLCTSPYRGCGDAIPVQPAPTGCYYQQVQCVKAPCDPILVCPSPTPRSSCTPRPACLDGNPACMVATPEQGWCPVSSSSPTPSTPPTCRGRVTNLKLSNRCGSTGFATYYFSCERGKAQDITSEVCLEASEIYARVQNVCSSTCTTHDQPEGPGNLKI